jgi:rRNA processing protein Krr1/Pno1
MRLTPMKLIKFFRDLKLAYDLVSEKVPPTNIVSSIVHEYSAACGEPRTVLHLHSLGGFKIGDSLKVLNNRQLMEVVDIQIVVKQKVL